MISLPWKCRQDYFQIVRAASSSTEMYNYSLMKASWLYQLKILTLRVFLFFVCPNFYFLKVFYLTPRAPMTLQTFPLNLTLFFYKHFYVTAAGRECLLKKAKILWWHLCEIVFIIFLCSWCSTFSIWICSKYYLNKTVDCKK